MRTEGLNRHITRATAEHAVATPQPCTDLEEARRPVAPLEQQPDQQHERHQRPLGDVLEQVAVLTGHRVPEIEHKDWDDGDRGRPEITERVGRGPNPAHTPRVALLHRRFSVIRPWAHGLPSLRLLVLTGQSR